MLLSSLLIILIIGQVALITPIGSIWISIILRILSAVVR